MFLNEHSVLTLIILVPQTGGAVSYDYETIKSIVLQIMREQGADGKIFLSKIRSFFRGSWPG